MSTSIPFQLKWKHSITLQHLMKKTKQKKHPQNDNMSNKDTGMDDGS